MFDINSFFARPLSPEGEELERQRRVREYEEAMAQAKPGAVWKPKHDPSFYDNKIPEAEVEPPLHLDDLVPSDLMVPRQMPAEGIMGPGRSQLPGRTSAEKLGRVRKSAKKLAAAQKKEKRNKQAEKAAEKERLILEGRELPPQDPFLAGNEAIFDNWLRDNRRTTATLRNKATILQILEEITQRPEIAFVGLETYVKRIYDLSKMQDLRVTIVPGIGQRLVATLMGYHSWADMKGAATVNRNAAKNLRDGVFDLSTEGLVQVKDVAEVLRKKNEGIRTRRTLHRDETEVYDGSFMAGKFSAAQILDLLNDYVASWRTPKLVPDKEEVRSIALKRFFGMERMEELERYIVAKVFPPSFKPANVDKKEVRLFFHIRKAMLDGEKFTALTAFQKLKPWCATPEMEQELERTIGELADGKPHRYASFIRRRYGIVILTLDHKAGVGFITEDEKIVRLVKLIPKVQETDPIDSIPEEDRQPEFVEQPRIVLTSHDPAFKAAFRETLKLKK